MKYKVREGHTLTWPDGSTWAEEGEVVELYDDIQPPLAAAWMQSIAHLGGARQACYRVEDEDAKAVEMPTVVRQGLMNRGYVLEETKPKPVAKKARRKKPVDTEESAE